MRRLLCTLSSDDYSIIKMGSNGLQNRFMAIGLFVLLICILCFIGSFVTFTGLFQNYLIGIPLAIFFAWMITNIYLLLLYTLSKNSFPCITNTGARAFSFSIRILFISFIAIIVSKPIESLVYALPLSGEIYRYKQQQITTYTESTTTYFDNEINNIKIIIDRQKAMNVYISPEQMGTYMALIRRREEQRDKLIESMIILVNHSNYYIEGIKILNRNFPSCWIITVVSILIFLVPAYLKNLLGANSTYYEHKGRIERQLVLDEYAIFRKRYTAIFKEMHSMDKTFVEVYMDPPFNTIRKKDERVFLTESELLTDLYDG